MNRIPLVHCMQSLATILLFAATTSAAAQPAPDLAATGAPPNLILFLVDDLGWQDTSVPFHTVRTPFNDVYRTPNMERLARQGMVFTSAYAASPVCTPTRTSLMTGRHPARTHITNWTLRNDRDAQETGPKNYPLRSPHWDVDGLQPGDVTLPALLRTRGYHTIHIGKAHFGALGTPGADPAHLGFDVNVAGHAAGGPGSFYGTDHFSATRRRVNPSDQTVWDVPGLAPYHGQDVYLTDALTREAANALDGAVAEGKPFFLNMAHYAVHAPIMADSQYVGYYAGMDSAEAAYASMIEGTDASLGALLAKLDALGVAEETLILFMSDNGGLSAHSRGTTPMGTGRNTHNLPLRSGKGSAYEGGTRVPMLVAWARPDAAAPVQQALPIAAGTRTDVPVTSHDFFPTLLELAGAVVPEGYVTDGQSLVPLLSGRPGFAADRLLAWHYPHKWGPEGPGLDPFTSVRAGNWKLIYFYKDRRWELYDLARDPGETTDLAWARPEVARRLAAQMTAWMQAVGAQVPHVRATDRPVARPAFEQPNIIYILADDLGYAELGSYGQTKIRTPHLDRLAAEGMRFTQHYSGSPVCAPSRATLLTGKHTGHAQVRDNYELGGFLDEEERGQLPLQPGTETIGTMLQARGYTTAAIGKWGLGGPGSTGLPTEQGFDFFYGYLDQKQAHNYYPTHLWRGTAGGTVWDTLRNAYFHPHQRLAALPDDPNAYERYKGTDYAPDLMTEEALRFIREHRDAPFFLYLAYPIPHVSLQVPDEAQAAYDFEETPYLGQQGYLPHPRPRAAYAAMVSRMDAYVGQILALLETLGLDANTLVLFSSDNGPTFNGGSDSEFFDSAGPLRGLKTQVYEGGIRVPMIARWPGAVPAGTTTDHASAFWDVLYTLADVTGATPPGGLDGISFLPTLLGRPGEQPQHDYFYWEYHNRWDGAQAVRMGDWKAVRLGGHEDPNAPVELYDLSVDPGEQHDVAARHPDVARRMRSIMDEAHTPSEIERWNFATDGSR